MSYAIEIDDIKKDFTSSKYLIMNRKVVHALKVVYSAPMEVGKPH
jgi:hypothetical protein